MTTELSEALNETIELYQERFHNTLSEEHQQAITTKAEQDVLGLLRKSANHTISRDDYDLFCEIVNALLYHRASSMMIMSHSELKEAFEHAR